jgi:hypothetical protein
MAMKTHAYPEVQGRRGRTISRSTLYLSCALLCLSQNPAHTQEETCKSARETLREELPSYFPRAQRLAVLDLNTSKPVSAAGPGGLAEAYECWATVAVWNSAGTEPKTLKVIYTVANMKDTIVAPGLILVAVGIAYVCGESKEWDRVYAPCM